MPNAASVLERGCFVFDQPQSADNGHIKFISMTGSTSKLLRLVEDDTAALPSN